MWINTFVISISELSTYDFHLEQLNVTVFFSLFSLYDAQLIYIKFQRKCPKYYYTYKCAFTLEAQPLHLLRFTTQIYNNQHKTSCSLVTFITLWQSSFIQWYYERTL